MRLQKLEEAMGGTLPREVSRVMRALSKLDAAMDEVEAAGMRIRVHQKIDSYRHGGFSVTIDGRFNVENIHVPERPRVVRSA